MTFREACLSLQLASEERVGAPYRRMILEAKAAEDRIASAQAAALDATRR